MDFAHGADVVRQRRRRVPDPYNPDRTTTAPWEDDPDTLPIADAFVSTSSSSAGFDAARGLVVTTRSLYCSDPTVDVQRGDRIVHPGGIGYVRTIPAADVNPFTGWQPVKEIVLAESEED